MSLCDRERRRQVAATISSGHRVGMASTARPFGGDRFVTTDKQDSGLARGGAGARLDSRTGPGPGTELAGIGTDWDRGRSWFLEFRFSPPSSTADLDDEATLR